MDREITGLSDKLSKALVSKGRKKVAPIDFVDLQGRPTELGRFLAEQLSVELVNAEGISVVDRANIKSILAEHKLTEEGLVKPENAKQLGQFAGIDAFLIGTVTPMDDTVVLTVKAVSTETAEVIAAGKASFKKTSEIQQLLNRGVSANGSDKSGSPAATAFTATAPSAVEPNAIVTKEMDTLRCTLLRVMPLKGGKPQRRRSILEAPDVSGLLPAMPGDESKKQEKQVVIGITCAFEFVNLDLAKAVSLACNAKAVQGERNNYITKGTLTDSNGNLWQLYGTKGVPIIACGCEESTSRIVSLLRTGESDLNSAHGFAERGYLNTAQYGRNVWTGDFVTIDPGKSIRVTLTYTCVAENGQMRGDGSLPSSFAFETELIVGVHDATVNDVKRIPWKLKNLVIDRVNVPKSDTE